MEEGKGKITRLLQWKTQPKRKRKIKLLEGMGWGKGTIRWLLQWKMQWKRKSQENYWKQWTEGKEQSGAYWKSLEGVKGKISCLLKWKMHRKGRVQKLPFSAKKLRVHSTTKPIKAKTPWLSHSRFINNRDNLCCQFMFFSSSLSVVCPSRVTVGVEVRLLFHGCDAT